MQPGFSCRQQSQQREMQRQRGGGFPFGLQNREHMPRLVLPDSESANARGPALARIGGFSGSSDDFETQGRVSGELDLAELNDHFVEQLQAQGWQPDSEWNGDVTAGSNWTYSPEDNLDYIGILTMARRSEAVTELKFRMMTRNSASTGGGFFRGIISQ